MDLPAQQGRRGLEWTESERHPGLDDRGFDPKLETTPLVHDPLNYV